MHQAKTQLSDLVARAEAGEEIVIARRNKPAVKLVPVGDTDKVGFAEDEQARLDMIGLRQVGEAGREFTIMRDGKAVAKVAPAVAEKPRRKPGGLKGMFTLPDRFFDPLPDDEVAAWEGKYSSDPGK